MLALDFYCTKCGLFEDFVESFVHLLPCPNCGSISKQVWKSSPGLVTKKNKGPTALSRKLESGVDRDTDRTAKENKRKKDKQRHDHVVEVVRDFGIGV
jgi:predicted  nucleic acid-binding Zn-ribbon protein